MKNYLLMATLSLLIFGCAKKTRTSESYKISNQIKEINDSTGKSNLITRDNSVITTTIDLDTAIRLTGTTLIGILDSGELVKHYENDDLSIDFKRDQSGLNIAFKAVPKNKTINVRYHKKVISQDNILKSEKSQSHVGKELAAKQDSTYNHLTDYRDPTSLTSDIKSVIIWAIILLLLLAAIYYVVKKKLI